VTQWRAGKARALAIASSRRKPEALHDSRGLVIHSELAFGGGAPTPPERCHDVIPAQAGTASQQPKAGHPT